MNAKGSNSSQSEYDLLTDLTALLPLYVVYIFLSGWAFNDYYFRFFGLDPRFLDLGFHDTLLRGFTVMFVGSAWMWCIYPLLFASTLLLSRSRIRIRYKVPIMLTVLVGALLAIFFLSSSAGQEKARIDKGNMSTLPTMTFNYQQRALTGRLVYLKGDLYFIDRVRAQGSEDSSGLQVTIYRTSEINDIRITEHQ